MYKFIIVLRARMKVKSSVQNGTYWVLALQLGLPKQ